MPALPLDEAGQYVAGAYLVFLALIVTYVAIIGAKIGRIDRELGELVELAGDEDGREPLLSPRAGDRASSNRGAADPAEVSNR